MVKHSNPSREPAGRRLLQSILRRGWLQQRKLDWLPDASHHVDDREPGRQATGVARPDQSSMGPLFLILQGRATTLAELSRELQIDAGALTRTLDRLEAKGLCRRERSTEDRRVVNLALTDESRHRPRCPVCWPTFITICWRVSRQGGDPDELDASHAGECRAMRDGCDFGDGDEEWRPIAWRPVAWACVIGCDGRDVGLCLASRHSVASLDTPFC